jgi:(E)-4-hydroxy-3-methylbut-2-enyl-diphosphate synthase
MENGADAVRINPGNIGSEQRVKKVIDCAKLNNISIRIGVNGGSLQKDLLCKYGGVTSDALVESVLNNLKLIEKFGFGNLKISIKVSDVLTTVEAYRKISELTDYPLHVGVTEAGTLLSGSIKSALGIGILLSEGIGDTIRVSLTGDPVEEVLVAYKILNFLNIRKRGVEIISCPTCGRTDINVVNLAQSLEKKLAFIDTPIKVAVMGCVVNGPGEAKEADIGIAGGKGVGLIFKKGNIFKKVKESQLEEELIKEIKKMIIYSN